MVHTTQFFVLFFALLLLCHVIQGGLQISKVQPASSPLTVHEPFPLFTNLSHSSNPQTVKSSPTRSSKHLFNTKDSICCYESDGSYQYCTGTSVCCRKAAYGCTGSYICAPYGSTCCGTGYCASNTQCETCGSATGCLPYGATCCGSGYCNSGYYCTANYQCQANSGGGGNSNNNGGSSNNGGLGTGAIIGIAVGSSVGGIIILVGLIGGCIAIMRGDKHCLKEMMDMVQNGAQTIQNSTQN
ncbi:hypothetical protein C9374_008492 [Naegleria lovaniensis]|uniref:Uncharacterized protein n=1 Tax=Naegleria lovaniensis TaxID=51637 RepID=A0AA88GIZ8_NAELO|nr:uncharacterized protein C9374_008492 [Naegleria lovaniensis]KAG2378349.1 hypothetical protein C9374_008492 [Naegleria lovaniensis]